MLAFPALQHARSLQSKQHNTAQEVGGGQLSASHVEALLDLLKYCEYHIDFSALCTKLKANTEEKKEKNYVLKYFDFTEANKGNVTKCLKLNCVGAH